MDFGAFGDWWDSGLGSWFSEIDWGTAPAWAGALFSAGALLLTLRIISRDRKRDYRAMADGFVTWSSQTLSVNQTSGKYYTLKVYGHNTTDVPIPTAVVRSRAAAQPNFVEHFTEKDWKFSIPPKSEVSVEIVMEVPPRTVDVVVEFKDARGKWWMRDLYSNRYLTKRQYKNFRRPAEGWKEAKGKYRDPFLDF